MLPLKQSPHESDHGHLPKGGRRMRWRIVLAALFASLALTGFLVNRHQSFTANQSNSQTAAKLDTVKKGVFLAGYDMSHWRLSQVEQLLRQLAADFGSDPVDAREDPINRSSIPDLNGLELDVEQTLQRVIDAPAGSRVVPVLKQKPADVQLNDLPPLPIRHGNPAKRAVTLMFNVAWGNDYLEPILTQLESTKTIGSFFLVGQWAEKYPDLAKRIASAGHEINSHGYSTVGMAALSEGDLLSQLNRANEAIEQATGIVPTYFSPHRGEYNEHLLRLTRENGQQTILWSMDTVDWKNPGRDWILRRIERLLHPGGLVLMHPTASTVEALPDVIALVRQNGYRIISLDDMLSPDPLR